MKNSELEIWKPIPDWEEYEVSNLGRVRSLDRVRRQGLFKGKVLKPCIVGGGYHAVGLRHPFIKYRMYKIHKLVLSVFVGPRPKGKETRHLDGDKTNNKLSNLCYGTKKQNEKDRIKHGTTFRSAKTRQKQSETKFYRFLETVAVRNEKADRLFFDTK